MIAYFMDFELETGNSTFFPRPETELLVNKALGLLSKRRNTYSRPCILDIGTGCGNISISLTKYLPLSRIVALDILPTALRIAKDNACKYGVADRIEFISSDLFRDIEDIYEGHFDMVISNPPYVSLEDFLHLPQRVKDDPFIALYGGKDGLDFYREIIREAYRFLRKEGYLLLEIGYDQSMCLKNLLRDNDVYGEIEVYKDYAGIDRIIKAKSSYKRPR